MKECAVTDCTKAAKASRGWCWGHYQRWIKYGDPEGGFVQKPCSVDDCDRVSRSGGMCTLHYERVRQHGSPHVRLTMPGGSCSTDGCDAQSFGKGLCQNHYYAKWVEDGGRRLKAAAIARRRAMVAGAGDVDRTLSWLSLWESGLRTCSSCSKECRPDDFKMIVNRAGRTQKICGMNYPTLDHIQPLSAGGAHVRSNVDLLCMDCNRRKCARVARSKHHGQGPASTGDRP